MFQPTIKEFADKQKEIFEEKLSRKTGWGKNEIKVLLLEATSEALAELLSQPAEKKEVIPGGMFVKP